jgi:hypothetical protein
VEYDLDGIGGGPRDLSVEILALGSEPELELGGRVLLDGREVGELGPVRAGDGDVVSEQVLALDMPAGARRLRFETVAGGYLRLRRLRVSERRATQGGRE